MRILFLGSPEFAIPSLLRLLGEGHKIVGIITQPDRCAGRGMLPTPPPVKRWGQRLGLPVSQPQNLREGSLLAALQALEPELGVVVAYGRLLPPDLLWLPARGCVNVHASLLPRYRGAAPIARAILAGEKMTGITIMQMEEGLDTGPILLQVGHPIYESDQAGSLHDRLALLGAEALGRALSEMERDNLHPVAQDHEQATYAPPLKKGEGVVAWERPAADLDRLIRAFSPRPGAYTSLGGRRVKILQARCGGGECGAAPGTIIAVGAEGIRVATGSGSLILLRVHPEGRRPQSAAEFARGQRIVPGDRFDEGAKDGS